MNQDEIIEMAIGIGLKYRKNNNEIYTPDCDGIHIDELQLFSELVAQHEREACAKLCEELRDDWFRGLGRYEFMGEGADYCSDAIRARGQA
jgi:hypothetical protein